VDWKRFSPSINPLIPHPPCGKVYSTRQVEFSHTLGRLRERQENVVPDALRPMNHHIGTTRMDNDPHRGVVNSNCRVHGINNLYIAGSSVFPTAGHANPTLTLMALAFRLSDHLKGFYT